MLEKRISTKSYEGPPFPELPRSMQFARRVTDAESIAGQTDVRVVVNELPRETSWSFRGHNSILVVTKETNDPVGSLHNLERYNPLRQLGVRYEGSNPEGRRRIASAMGFRATDSLPPIVPRPEQGPQAGLDYRIPKVYRRPR